MKINQIVSKIDRLKRQRDRVERRIGELMSKRVDIDEHLATAYGELRKLMPAGAPGTPIEIPKKL